MSQQRPKASGSAGFSLIELLVAMGVTLVIMSIASALLGQSFNLRERENDRTEALSDVQRALNTMSREIANAGYGLNSLNTNGIVAADSNDSQIRVRANLDGSASGTNGQDEDVLFSIINNGDQRLITRYNINAGANGISSLANRVDTLTFTYLNADNSLATGPGTATKVRITVGVTLQQVGTPGQRGFQPASRTQVSSDVTLRNRNLAQF